MSTTMIWLSLAAPLAEGLVIYVAVRLAIGDAFASIDRRAARARTPEAKAEQERLTRYRNVP